MLSLKSGSRKDPYGRMKLAHASTEGGWLAYLYPPLACPTSLCFGRPLKITFILPGQSLDWDENIPKIMLEVPKAISKEDYFAVSWQPIWKKKTSIGCIRSGIFVVNCVFFQSKERSEFILLCSLSFSFLICKMEIIMPFQGLLKGLKKIIYVKPSTV